VEQTSFHHKAVELPPFKFCIEDVISMMLALAGFLVSLPG